MTDVLLRGRGGRWAVLATVLIVSVAAGVAAVLGAVDSKQTDAVASAIVSLAVGSSFVAAGLVAWWSRPANRTGALMTACGLAFIGGAWQASGDGWLFVAGAVLGLVAFSTFVHLILAFPDGHVVARVDRWLLRAAYAIPICALIAVPFVQPTTVSDCKGCPANPLAVADDHTLTFIVFRATEILTGAGVFVLLVLLVLRWRRASGLERRRIAPVLWAAIVATSLSTLAIVLQPMNENAGMVAQLLFIAAVFCLPIAFLVGILRDRLQRTAAMQDLVVRLAQAEGPDDLRQTLAAALRDPELRIAFWFPEREIYVDYAGHPIDVPERGVTVVERNGERIARLVHDPALDAEPALLQAVAAAAAIGLERARLEAELRARLDELRASRSRIVEAIYIARRRLERDLHDGAQQRLVGLSLNLRMIRARLGGDPATAELVDAAQAELTAALEELRELARGIHPAILTDRGLEVALQSLADRSPVPVELDVEPGLDLPPPQEAAVYFVASEALTNVIKYADASRVAIQVSRGLDTVIVEIADDGVGGARIGAGSGLAGLHDRVEALDGRFAVDSPAHAGTVVRATLPVPLKPTAPAPATGRGSPV